MYRIASTDVTKIVRVGTTSLHTGALDAVMQHAFKADGLPTASLFVLYMAAGYAPDRHCRHRTRQGRSGRSDAIESSRRYIVVNGVTRAVYTAQRAEDTRSGTRRQMMHGRIVRMSMPTYRRDRRDRHSSSPQRGALLRPRLSRLSALQMRCICVNR